MFYHFWDELSTRFAPMKPVAPVTMANTRLDDSAIDSDGCLFTHHLLRPPREASQRLPNRSPTPPYVMLTTAKHLNIRPAKTPQSHRTLA
jgi:hypothetical protein